MQQSLFGATVLESESNQAQVESPRMDALIQDTVFTVIDLETTGLNAKRNSITEITAIQFKNGEEVAKFSTLVKPTEDISPEVEAITGINNAMVQQAPPLITVLSDLCAFVGREPIIVGHNVPFDIRFLQEKLQATGLTSFADRFILSRAFCTKALAVKAMPGLPGYDGMMVASQLGVHNPNPHRAEYDVRMSAGILFALVSRLQQKTPALKTVQDLLDYQGLLG